jgi:glycosyltransferase involved in cell wall biosynthesis
VCGEAARVIPGYEAGAWAEAVQGLLDSPSARADLRARGLAHAPKFRWAETARQTWQAYEAALSS